ncbi:hypothetical protein [Arthrobacter pigmenti]
MSTLVLVLALTAVAALYFGIGRAACPQHDRLPCSELNRDDVMATIERGWQAAGEHSELRRIADAMCRRSW